MKFENIQQAEKALEALDRSTSAFSKMTRAELTDYGNSLRDFSEALALLDTSHLEASDAIIQAQITKKYQQLTNHFEEESAKFDFARTFGFKKASVSNSLSAEEEKKLADDKKDKVAEAQKEIEEKRNQETIKNFSDPVGGGILASAVSEFRKSLIPPLLAVDIEELTRKRQALDETKAAQDAYGVSIRGLLAGVKRLTTSTLSVVGELVEETTGGVFKATALFLAWPVILPIKAINQGLTATKYAFCAADGVLGFFDKGLDKMLPKIDKTESGDLIWKLDNAPAMAMHTVLRGPFILGRGICQAASIGCRFLERNIDADRWMKSKPVTAGFSVGGIGVAVLIGLTLASIPGLGIPLAIAVGAFAIATAGALVQGYFKGKKREAELRLLRLDPGEATQLAKYEYENTLKNNIGSKLKQDNPQQNETVQQAQHDKTEQVIKNIHTHHQKHQHQVVENMTEAPHTETNSVEHHHHHHHHTHHEHNPHTAHMDKAIFSHGHDHHSHHHEGHHHEGEKKEDTVAKREEDDHPHID